MSEMAHRIRRQRWEVHAAGEVEALALRTALRAGLEGALQPAIERAFASVDADDRVVHVPRLEVRLTLPARGGDFADALAPVLERAVADELRLLIEREHDAAAPARSAPALVARTVAGEGMATLLRYLRTGTLPWAAATGDAAGEADALRATLGGRAAEVVEALVAAGARREQWFRLLQLAGDAEWLDVARALGARLPAGWTRVLASGAVGDVGTRIRDAPSRHARLGVAATLLEHAARGARPEAAVAATFVALRSADERRALAPLVAALVLPDDTGLGAAAPITASGHDAAREPPEHEGVDQTGAAATTGAARPTVASGARLLGEATADVLGGALSDDDAADTVLAEIGRPLAVASAGLVLLHPYVGRLFAYLGLLSDGGDEIADGALPRAAALLHFLATGRDEPLELELGLVKVLLGLAPDDALSVGGGLLSDDDTTEAEALLEAVIEHWSVLGRTSAAGLRGSFLRRPGLLRRVDEGWALHVEATTFDVLLDHLPWGISVVRLPWMRDTIYTEWTTR